VTTERRFQLQKHQGFQKIATFPGTGMPGIFAARPDLDPRIAFAFGESLNQLPKASSQSARLTQKFDFDEPFSGATPIDDSYFDEFRSVLEKAAQFEEVTTSELMADPARRGAM
jgi:hypothetical protein